MPIALTIVADDFGMSSAYDDGILEAARAGAIDAASVMVRRSPDRIGELIASGIDVGLHLEGAGAEEVLDEDGLLSQLAAFGDLAGRGPDHIDGHHHCHSRLPEVAAIAVELGIPVRSVSADHRCALRSAGARTPDLLVGRYEEGEPVIPAELTEPPAGTRSIEWMVHPGRPDPETGSDYDAGRAEDLAVLLSFAPPPGLARTRWRGP
jgi:predicted glycoside hydrolase/deacetylase ChbG (UPF0249 family)